VKQGLSQEVSNFFIVIIQCLVDFISQWETIFSISQL